MTSRTQSSGSTLLALLVGLLLLSALVFKSGLSSVPSIAQTKASSGFDATLAVGRLARILGDERPHPVDTPANDAVRERLIGEITALGFTPEVRDDFACRGSKRWGGASCARVRNVMFRMGPSGGNAVMVASHYDSVPAGPGAADDGIGVSSALEIAARLKGRTLAKPVIFLFTDGEEFGLLGAASFVRSDPWMKDIALAINLEARGTGGPAIMFQTSMPNGSEIAALKHRRVPIIANSMAADIYRTLPNDTDATEFLAKKIDVLNFAIIDPVARYHTPLDSLKYLEHESVGHMGAAALAAIEGHLAAGPKAASEAHVIYSDILGRHLLVMPQMAGAVLLGLGFIAAGFAFFTNGPKGAVRAFIAPVIAAVAAAALGYASLFAINSLRAEGEWWSAVPLAAKLVFYGAGVLGLMLALWLCKGTPKGRIVAAGWLWLSALILGLALLSPGAMILVAPAAGLFALCVLVSGLLKKRLPHLLPWLSFVPALLLAIMMLPVLDFAEVGLGFGLGFGFAGLAALIGFVIVAPLMDTDARLGAVSLALTLPLIGGIAWAGLAPAFSQDLPQPINLEHVHSDSANNWMLTPGNPVPPQAMMRIVPFKKTKIYGITKERIAAPAPATSEAVAQASVQILSDEPRGDGRVLKLRFTAVDVDEIAIAAPEAAKLTQFTAGSAVSAVPLELNLAGDKFFRCSGRACGTWDIEVVLGKQPTDWTIKTVKRGQGPEADALLKARPNTAAPIQGGDVRTHFVKVSL